jgi:hypothetical protein
MAIGPGKYDAACTEAREKTGAAAVLLIVIDGTLGSGFSCQADLQTTVRLPEILETIAEQIRHDGIAG